MMTTRYAFEGCPDIMNSSQIREDFAQTGSPPAPLPRGEGISLGYRAALMFRPQESPLKKKKKVNLDQRISKGSPLHITHY